MIHINFSIRPYIKGSTVQVAIKVRWNQSRFEASFFTKVWAEVDKWDRSKIISLLDDVDEEFLKDLLSDIQIRLAKVN